MVAASQPRDLCLVIPHLQSRLLGLLQSAVHLNGPRVVWWFRLHQVLMSALIALNDTGRWSPSICAAPFASVSASLSPQMSEWPGIHWKITGKAVRPSHSRARPSRILVLTEPCTILWLSVAMVMVVF